MASLSIRDHLTKLVTGRLPDGAASLEEREEKDKLAAAQFKEVQYWNKELDLAETFVRDWHDDADRAVDNYLDDYGDSLPTRPKYRLNLFHANVTTLMSIMVSQTPKVEADRRFADPNDDVGRVAAEMMTRLLQNDMNDPDDTYVTVLRQALQDRLLAGLGVARVRYSMTEEGEGDLAAKKDEWCDIEYHHWRDVLWSPCRTPAELRWKAFRVYMTKAEVIARFGEEVAEHIPYSSRGANLEPENGAEGNVTQGEAHSQAAVWEIWDKPSKTVRWYVKGYDKFLDKKDDPVGFDGFWCDPPWLVANVTTKRYLPKPDFMLASDLYEEINELEARVALLTKACKVVGVYPANATEIGRLLTEACENQMIPVEAWAMFAERGGLKGQIDYFPVKDVVEAIAVLSTQQQMRIQQLYQVTGMSDILRGQATTQGVTATEQRIKAQFASTRIQFLQEEFAVFATELLNKKVTLIRKYYDPERIKALSNIMSTPDAQFADQAIALIKDESAFNCRVVIRAESLAQIDYDSLKQERGEFMNAVSAFLGNAGPVLEQMPDAAPFLLELLKFQLAGMKGANQMEGVIDAAIAGLLKKQEADAQKPPEPTPEERAEQAKVQGQMQIEQGKAQIEQQKMQAQFQMDQEKMRAELAMKQREMDMKLRQMEEEHRMDMAKLMLDIRSMQAKLKMEKEKLALDAAGKQQDLAHKAESAAIANEQKEEQFEQSQRHAEESHEREGEERDE
jgi:hypothetical protein